MILDGSRQLVRDVVVFDRPVARLVSILGHNLLLCWHLSRLTISARAVTDGFLKMGFSYFFDDAQVFDDESGNVTTSVLRANFTKEDYHRTLTCRVANRLLGANEAIEDELRLDVQCMRCFASPTGR